MKEGTHLQYVVSKVTSQLIFEMMMPIINLFFGYQRLEMLWLHFTRVFAKCPQMLEHYI